MTETARLSNTRDRGRRAAGIGVAQIKFVASARGLSPGFIAGPINGALTLPSDHLR
jgi:hypothetical protein